MILNIAMGGNLGGPIDASFTSTTFEIDYVRVYQ
jgi:beta-glucanase (GH16 family)